MSYVKKTTGGGQIDPPPAGIGLKYQRLTTGLPQKWDLWNLINLFQVDIELTDRSSTDSNQSITSICVQVYVHICIHVYIYIYMLCLLQNLDY